LKQRAVFQFSPTHFLRSLDGVGGKEISQRARDASIQQDFHAA
jgi:hypothetical protein